MIQWRGFLGRLLGPLLKTGLPLIKNLIKPLAKSVFKGLTTAASAADVGILKKFLGSARRHPSSTTLMISHDEMKDIIKIVPSLHDSGLLLKGVTETVQNEVKEQKGGFLSTLLGILGASLLENILAGKGAIVTSQERGINRTGKSRGINRAREGIVRANYSRRFSKNKMHF